VLLHRAQLRRPDDGFAILLGKISRESDLEIDPVGLVRERIELDPLIDPDAVARDTALLAEARDVDTRARSDRSEEQLERGRSRSVLIRAQRQSAKAGIHPVAPGKIDGHLHIARPFDAAGIAGVTALNRC
jgi:hypothetical protein